MRAAGEKLNRAATLAVCAGWAGGFVWLLAGGGYVFFLAPAYRFLLAGGAAVLAAYAAALLLRPATACEHTHPARVRWVALAVLTVPLAWLVVNPRPVPGSAAFENRSPLGRLWRAQQAVGVVDYAFSRPRPTTAPADDAPPPMPDANAPLSPLDVAEAYPHNVGEEVTVRGMVYRDDRLPPNTIVLFRFVITCCAADAWPASTFVTAPGITALPRDRWVAVRGTVRAGRVADMDVPVIHAKGFMPVRPPANPYVQRIR